MATTTAGAIRSTIQALVKAIVPAIDSELAFVPYLNQREASFRRDCQANPAACTRRVQVRARHADKVPDVTNTDVIAERVHIDIIVAYAQTHRFGADAGLDRDDAIDSDRMLIENTVGREGYQNVPNATWLTPGAPGSETETRVERPDEGGVDFLVITQTMRFYRAR